MEKYKLTDEHRKKLEPWANKWIKNAMSTCPISDEEKPKIIHHVKELYKAANLIPPPDHRIIFVKSPFIGRFASGFASMIWYIRKNKMKNIKIFATEAATRDATRDATWAATWAATRVATWDAIEAATRAATRAATMDATEDATREATRDATWAATEAATREATMDATADATWAATEDATRDATADATWDATRDATMDATRDATREATDAATWAATREATADATKSFQKYSKWYVINGDLSSLAKKLFKNQYISFLECTIKANKLYNGGNMWSGYSSYISFFRYIAMLKIDYSKWEHYEALSELTGPRYMHQEFCIICDRPEILTTDDTNRPHNDNGPFCQWRDGSALYAYHGVRIPAWVIEFPESITIEKIQSETNMEIQRVMIEKYGVDKYLMDIKATIIDMDTLTLEGSAPRALIRDDKGNQWLIGTDGSSQRVYNMAISSDIKTCRDAHNLLAGFDESRLLAEC